MKRVGLILFVVFCCSCEKALFESDASASKEAVFDQLWQTMNEKYTFFDIKGVDWEVLGDTYR
ncbi:MAG: hypothetical protein LAT54_10340, partial [Cryomorphaceae bacterium]|nr:hypothetical protein [Cryomorphaceae bacterium]